MHVWANHSAFCHCSCIRGMHGVTSLLIWHFWYPFVCLHFVRVWDSNENRVRRIISPFTLASGELECERDSIVVLYWPWPWVWIIERPLQVQSVQGLYIIQLKVFNRRMQLWLPDGLNMSKNVLQRRLRKELASMHTDSPPGIRLHPTTVSSGALTQWVNDIVISRI